MKDKGFLKEHFRFLNEILQKLCTSNQIYEYNNPNREQLNNTIFFFFFGKLTGGTKQNEVQ